jgi:hypothetical protein
MGLGGRFWLATAGITIAAAIGGFLVFMLIGWAWYSWGLLGAFLLIGGIGIAVAYVFDRREQRRDELTA